MRVSTSNWVLIDLPVSYPFTDFNENNNGGWHMCTLKPLYNFTYVDEVECQLKVLALPVDYLNY